MWPHLCHYPIISLLFGVVVLRWQLESIVVATKLVKPTKNHVDQRRFCDICGLGFRRVPEYEKHLLGNRHRDTLSKTVTPEVLWAEFQASAPHWVAPELNVSIISPMWKNDELTTLDFRRRETTLHPSPTIGKLKPVERARVWRYMRDVMGYSYYPELATILTAVDSDEEGHVRVKELFESLEAYKVISNFIVAAQRTAEKNGLPKVERIVELACGHGLVGVLLAYRFRNLDVHLYDLEKRKTFEAFLRAFSDKGVRHPGDDEVLQNVFFHEADMRTSQPEMSNSIVVCLHGCGEVNELAIEMAIENKASGWAVMPCCIEKEQYLGSACHVNLSEDKARYNFLCGAMASRYNAQLIQAIDERITNRPLIIAGGVGVNAVSATEDGNGNNLQAFHSEVAADAVVLEDTEQVSEEDEKKYQTKLLAVAARRGNMPKLLLS